MVRSYRPPCDNTTSTSESHASLSGGDASGVIEGLSENVKSGQLNSGVPFLVETKGFVSRKQYIASFGNIAILQYSENIVIF